MAASLVSRMLLCSSCARHALAPLLRNPTSQDFMFCLLHHGERWLFCLLPRLRHGPSAFPPSAFRPPWYRLELVASPSRKQGKQQGIPATHAFHVILFSPSFNRGLSLSRSNLRALLSNRTDGWCALFALLPLSVVRSVRTLSPVVCLLRCFRQPSSVSTPASSHTEKNVPMQSLQTLQNVASDTQHSATFDGASLRAIVRTFPSSLHNGTTTPVLQSSASLRRT